MYNDAYVHLFFCFIPANQYEDQLQRDCCLDGLRDSPLSYSCERRSEYIVDDFTCVEAFLRCCKEMETKQAQSKEDYLQIALSKRGGGESMVQPVSLAAIHRISFEFL